MKPHKTDHLRSPIFKVFGLTVIILHRLNAVEWLKWGVKLVYSWITKVLPADSAARLDPITADIFIIAKWILLFWWMLTGSFTPIKSWLVAYLIIMNVFTYFYYHAWQIMTLEPRLTTARIQRRLVNVLLAISFSMLAFAYLYAGIFRNSMHWAPEVHEYRTEALLFSISNSLTVGYGAVQPSTAAARALCTTQLVNMFLFATIIVSASLSAMFSSPPQHKSKD